MIACLATAVMAGNLPEGENTCLMFIVMNYGCIKNGHCCREVRRTQTTPCASRLKAGRGSTPGLADSAPQPIFRRHCGYTEQVPLQKTAHDPPSYCMRMPFYPWRDNAQAAGARILKRRKFSRLSFFLYNNPCVLHCKISDSPKKGIGLFFFFFKVWSCKNT